MGTSPTVTSFQIKGYVVPKITAPAVINVDVPVRLYRPNPHVLHITQPNWT
ncbi:hypothetical protein Hanom_Chr02g00117661 [Helianthus anomalus]